MKKYAVCIDKILFCIYPCEMGPRDMDITLRSVPTGAYAIILMPSDHADFSAECYDSRGRVMKEPYLPLSALSFFFGTVRGFPELELDIEYSGEVYCVDTSAPQTCNFDKLPTESKPQLSKTLVLEDKIEISYYEIECDIRYRVFICDRSEDVSAAFLRSLLVRGVSCADIAVCASVLSDDIYLTSTSADYPLRTAFATISAMILSGYIAPDGEYTVHADRSSHRAMTSRGKLVFLSEALNFY